MSIKVYKSRMNVFIKSISDFIICSLILSNIFIENNFISISIFLLWISMNYIIGTYHIDDSFNKSNIKNNIILYTFSATILYSSLLFLGFNNEVQQVQFYKILSILILIIIRNFILRKVSEKIYQNKFIIINNKDFINKLAKYNIDSDELDKFFFINLDSFAEIKSINLKNINGIIFDDNLISEAEKHIMYKIKHKGLNLYNQCNWCEKYLQRIPIEFLSKKSSDNLFNKDKRNLHYRIKRIADLYLSIFILLITSPIILISMIFIYFEDKGTFFYSQTRTGLYGKKFKITKIRTMIMNAEMDGAQWSKKKDIRITKVGKYLRLTRIDELPQLISVIKGHMSLVGPRPERPEIDKILSKEIPNYNLRYLTFPGLSGWAQVNYPYGASVEDARNKLSFDIFYLKNQSVFLDLLIFMKTIRLILNAKGSIAKD